MSPLLFLGGALVALYASCTSALELQVTPVSEQVYALVGEIGPASADGGVGGGSAAAPSPGRDSSVGGEKAEPAGLESTLAFVVTLDGVVLIGSGGSPEQAAWIEAAVVRTTDRPIIRVINIGAEAYHWLGNGYFAQKGIPIFALERTDRAQRRLAETRLGQRPGAGSDQAAGVEPVFASEVIYDDEETFIMGGINFSLNWPGGGRLLGDSVVWLPTQKILISGDYIYHDRLLEFDEETPVMRWRQSFSRLMGMKPKTIVAGHGRPGSAGKSERQTGDYLSWLTGSLRQALAERESLEDIVARMARKEDFSRLALFEALHRENIRRAYRLMKGD